MMRLEVTHQDLGGIALARPMANQHDLDGRRQILLGHPSGPG